MNDLEPKNLGTSDSEDLDLKQQCAALKRQVTTLFLALVVVSGTLSVFLWRQAHYSRVDLNAMKQPAAQIIQAFNQEKPNMDAFLGRLADFGRTNPDFVPILNKYKISPPAMPIKASSPPPTGAP